MNYLIRKATIKDVQALAILFDEYRVFYKKESDVENAKLFLHDRITNNESVIFIAEKNNIISGFIQFYPLFSSTRMKRLWLLNDLYVNPNFRNKGMAIQLIETAKKFVADTNACGFILETEKTNFEANELYIKTNLIKDEDHNYYSYNI